MAEHPKSKRPPIAFPGADTTVDELEFALAMHAYQKKERRRYPAWSEVLHVLRSLGYFKGVAPEETPPAPRPFGPGLSHRPSLAEIESCS